MLTYYAFYVDDVHLQLSLYNLNVLLSSWMYIASTVLWGSYVVAYKKDLYY